MTGTRTRAVAALLALACLAAAGAPTDDAARGAAGAVVLEPPVQEVTTTVPAVGWPEPPAATATSYILLDRASGQVLAQRAPDIRRPVASTVKVLTALTVLDRVDPAEVVTIGSEVAEVGGAGVGLDPGERWTVRELLDALVVRSGNDAAVALAVHVGGSLEGFVDLMRADAAALGLPDAVLESPSGLEDRNRLTARELAVMTRAALDSDSFRDIASRTAVALPGLGTVETRNELLERYPGATGVKTGFTEAAGWSLVASAERDGRELIAVVLDARSGDARFDDAARLLDHGFTDFSDRQVEVEGRVRSQGRWSEVSAGPVRLSLPAEADDELVVAPLLAPELEAVAARLEVAYGGDLLATLDVDVSSPDPALPEGAAAIGAHVSDRVYAALRARAIGAVGP